MRLDGILVPLFNAQDFHFLQCFVTGSGGILMVVALMSLFNMYTMVHHNHEMFRLEGTLQLNVISHFTNFANTPLSVLYKPPRHVLTYESAVGLLSSSRFVRRPMKFY